MSGLMGAGFSGENKDRVLSVDEILSMEVLDGFTLLELLEWMVSRLNDDALTALLAGLLERSQQELSVGADSITVGEGFLNLADMLNWMAAKIIALEPINLRELIEDLLDERIITTDELTTVQGFSSLAEQLDYLTYRVNPAVFRRVAESVLSERRLNTDDLTSVHGFENLSDQLNWLTAKTLENSGINLRELIEDLLDERIITTDELTTGQGFSTLAEQLDFLTHRVIKHDAPPSLSGIKTGSEAFSNAQEQADHSTYATVKTIPTANLFLASNYI